MKFLRKLFVLFTGIPILIIGLILIPLPGPGFLISFIGLFILALEFEWAAKHRDNIHHQVKKINQKARDRANKYK